ncbi:MAG TPA: fumarylacetoacetase, partial [Saprospiraceae bacterium]|nr:fumarylacetoacetase [Saprospiraceae bacterium]
IGDQIIDLSVLHVQELLTVPGLTHKELLNRYLNDFISLGKTVTRQVRTRVMEIFSEDADHALRERAALSLAPVHEVELLLPLRIGNYTDFYSSKEHATNVGSMFRDPANALLPNWLHLPVGYHGRASSIVVSSTPIKRPSGQTAPGENGIPKFGPTMSLDFELEMGFVIGKETQLGQQVSTEEAEDYIFGLTLFNDWSARDIQQWEYVPLGPFLAKNFASTMSPWIVTLDALEQFRVDGPVQSPPVLPYLLFSGKKNYDIHLKVDITTASGHQKTVCNSNFKYMYWNMCQQLAHHTVNGCNIQVGDLYASGTISGPDPSSYGSMLELAWRGTKPIEMPDGSQRKFIQDGDTVTIRGFAEKDGVRVGFGEAAGKVV